MSRIRLISSDFDGTLIGHGSDGRCVASLAGILETYRDRGGLWAVNTGRGLDHAIEGLRSFQGPMEPQFLLTNEREVFRWDGTNAWLEHGDWNERCRLRHDELFERASALFLELETWAKRRSGFRLIYEEKRPIGLVTETEDFMEELILDLDQAASVHENFSYQRNTIYLRFCHRDYHKGSALEELCRLEGVRTEEVFAVGDHFNDLPMLDIRYAGMTACPANAIDPVKEKVRLASGYISAQPWADGVAEAFHFFEANAPTKK